MAPLWGHHNMIGYRALIAYLSLKNLLTHRHQNLSQTFSELEWRECQHLKHSLHSYLLLFRTFKLQLSFFSVDQSTLELYVSSLSVPAQAQKHTGRESG